MKKVYLDYAATTPVDPRVEKAMRPYWTDNFGNPGALYWAGQQVSAAVFRARNGIAKILGCSYQELIFTGSATEANNLALRGIIRGVIRNTQIKNPKIITSVIEHESVLATCKDLEKEGVEVIYLPVSKTGLIDVEKLKESLDKNTILVSIMYANNEIGVVQPIAEIAKIISDFKKNKQSSFPLFHTDAAQAFNYLDCDVKKFGVDLMTLSAQKIYGPKGIGLLYAKNRSIIVPVITGGGQEQGLRSGTENVPGIIGFAEAMVLADKARKKETKRIKSLRDKLEKGILKSIPRVVVNGHTTKRLPNLFNVSIMSIEGEAILLCLDKEGISVSTGSACSARALKPSHVLMALGCSYEQVQSTIRFSLGRYVSSADINYTLKVLPKIVKRLRKISPLGPKK